MIELDLHEEQMPAPRDVIRGSRWVATAVTLCLLLGLAGSVAIVRHLSRTAVLQVPAGASMTLSDRRLYVITGGDAPTLAAYTLTGQRLWQTASRFREGAYLQEAGDTLLINVNRSGTAQTIGVDALTGDERWSLGAQVQPLADGRTGLITTTSFTGTAVENAPEFLDSNGNRFFPAPDSTTLSAVDLAGGDTLWTQEFGGSARQAARPGTTEVVVADQAGVRVLDGRTGGVLRSVALTGGFAIEGFSVSDELIIAQQSGRRGGQTYAYRPDTLAEAWHVRMPGNMVVTGCADVPCATEVSELRMLDPATGAVSYEVNAGSVYRQGGRTLLVPYSGVEDLSIAPAPGGTPEALPGWTLVPASPAVADRTAAPVLLTRAGDGRVWLAALSGSGGPRELGSLAPAVLDCQSTVGMIACRTAVGEIRIWQLEGVRP
ncbi:PQQ-binding-like beta-propeller repeat protein [Catenuloplanes sp. NPDC051500]|uniref:outer membrane protein assembly factor BamB family protein n=1 Tax=Catenuloplanes sp. NPDC051500 TaxID=3363959 RepID=UPI0037A5D68B